MPELPEVETMRRGIAHVVGSVITELHVPQGTCKPIRIQPDARKMRRQIVGQTITSVGRRGKRVLAVLATGDAIIFEPRMTGLVLLNAPPDEEHVRVAIHLRHSHLATSLESQIIFWDRRGLGSVRVLDPEGQAKELGPHRLGPDALDISVSDLSQRFATSRSPIKVALLDQGRLAGIGNLYASEILFVAQIHPAVSCSDIKAAGWKRLHAAMQFVLTEAIRYEGSTLGDGTYRNALNQQGSYQNHHRVYQKSENQCLVCRRGTVRRITQSQRSTFFCPICQRLRKRA
ncbi:MAG: bifunctional DNA-formamidopyrimidine glycosylase/DNA-(apurinic or apyrimidinic site) lyase [Planctomycetota bacterium]|nr:bifunctional DNA-formamidopyrimidine glycosylase/DNA-(apurinic or apyrimidinic site) lyase [Planctomycetota bacterium]MDA1178297.1 bifunctional DNA-formamidopyrimidine glycosylase/DNA-(apurinic or apyrimidinic site) lyase [Planctomycetota bacterium]